MPEDPSGIIHPSCLLQTNEFSYVGFEGFEGFGSLTVRGNEARDAAKRTRTFCFHMYWTSTTVVSGFDGYLAAWVPGGRC